MNIIIQLESPECKNKTKTGQEPRACGARAARVRRHRNRKEPSAGKGKARLRGVASGLSLPLCCDVCVYDKSTAMKTIVQIMAYDMLPPFLW